MMKKVWQVILCIIVSSMFIVEQPVFGGEAYRRLRIVPGIGIDHVFELGMTYAKAQKKYKNYFGSFSGEAQGVEGQWTERLLGIGLHLFFNDDKEIDRVVIYNPEFITNRRFVHVFSRFKDVLLAYGEPEGVSRIEGGYSLKYQRKGIGFEIDSATETVKAIIVFTPENDPKME